MTTINQNFEIFQGDDKELHVQVTGEDGAFMDITGCTIIWKAFRDFQSPPENTLVKDLNNGLETLFPTQGIFVVRLYPEDTINRTGAFYHQATLKDTRGFTSTIMTGRITINRTRTITPTV